ncbi:MAG: hypothetical protein LBC88_03155 [Spirochaetaceae bacterium]|nr:hypothetical protein [Spirochaetaceae bacterium]
MSLAGFIFVFFLFSFFGWLFELFLEAAAGRGFVNRGFFYGPVVPVYAAGFFLAHILCRPLLHSPLLVFLFSSTACTVMEYIIGFLLEKYLWVRAWDYDLHPFTFWCNYKKRIALTASLTFGLFTLLVIYFLWSRVLLLLDFFGQKTVFIADILFVSVFCIDAAFSFRKYIKNKRAGLFSAANGLDYSGEDMAFFAAASKDILANVQFLESKKFVQHGQTSVYAHSVAVAKMCARLSSFWKVKDRASLIRAALLHDFFLYDWHTEWKLTHGFTHPAAAADNARAWFDISEKEYSLIRTHMWPFTLLHPPQYREGWYICFFDKVVSLSEIVQSLVIKIANKTSDGIVFVFQALCKGRGGGGVIICRGKRYAWLDP